MNPLFKDKVNKIEKLMKVILDNFFKNYSYPDADAKIDELPFPQLIISLKKTIDETLVDLYISNEGGDINDVLKILKPFGVSIKDGKPVYPTLEYFKETDPNLMTSCGIDIRKFDDYKLELEGCLYTTATSAYIYAIKRLFVALEVIDGLKNGLELADEVKFKKWFEETTSEDELYWAYDCNKSLWDDGYAFNEDLCIEFDAISHAGRRKSTNANGSKEERVIFVSDKRMFMDIYSSETAKTSKISDYIMVLETVIDILENKEHYDIPNETILDILNSVYNRILKVAVVSTINLYTRKADAPIKKGALKEEIRKAYSIGNDRWNNCMAYYSDAIFKNEELQEMARYIPKMKEVVEWL